MTFAGTEGTIVLVQDDTPCEDIRKRHLCAWVHSSYSQISICFYSKVAEM